MANFLKSLFVKGVEIDTASATAGKVLTYDGTKFAPATPGSGSLALDDLSDAVITTPTTTQFVRYNGTNWVNATISAGDVPTLNQNTTGSAATWTTARTVTLDGDLTGSVSINGSANATLTATIAANSVALGTDTTGNYMSGISGTSPVSVTHTAAEGSSATVALASGYGDTLNPYASKTANYVLAAPNGSSGAPTFRAIVASDIPTLNQNTTGTAATVTGAAQTAITSVGTLTGLTIGGAGANRFITINAPTGYYAIQYFAINGTNKWHYEVDPAGTKWSLVESGVAERIGVTNAGATFSGTVTATTFSGSGASLTSLPAGQLTGNIASARLSGGYTGITGLGTLSTTLTTTGNVVMNNGSPTAYFQDTDNRSAMIHVNSNLFYVLRGDGTNSLNWATVNGWWPLTIDLETNNATFGGTIFSVGTATSARFVTNNASPSLELGDWSASSTWSAVDGYNGYLLMGNTSDRACYLRSNNAAAVNIGANGSNTLVVNNGNIVVNGTTVNDTLNVIGGSAWFSAMPSSSGSTVVNVFGFLRYVSSRRELKDNIINVELSDGLDRILALRPVEFTMKPEYLADANELTPFDVKRGFIAQETAEVDHRYGQWGWVDENQMMATTPAINGELPLEEATPIYWNHDAVIADLVASIQNINARLQQLEIV